MTLRPQRLPVLVGVMSLWLVFSTASGDSTPRDQLRVIVQQQCVPHWLGAHDPSPCISVHVPGNDPAADGFAVLADRKGGAHLLLIPTRTIRGIESPDALAPGSFNYFDAAWQSRHALDAVVGHPLARSTVGMAVNQIRARSQDQMHIHMSCLGRRAFNVLQAEAERVGTVWTDIWIGDWHYHAMRIPGSQLGPVNPIALLADMLVSAQELMGEFTILVAGMEFRDGPGFMILAGSSVPGSELLLDSSCAVAQPKSD
jgi:CDP-diacylglycerol pyrophosphatase